MTGYLQNLAQNLNMDAIYAALWRIAAVFLCLTVHESCHGLAALALGDPTAKKLNRLSLNPLRHIDWFGLALMFTVGFGWAKPVPVNPRYFKNPKWGMAITALAGPASNFILAALSIIISRLLYGYFISDININMANTGAAAFTLAVFFISTARLSIGLGVFNLLPFPPLDGSKIAAAFLPDKIYMLWMRYERIGMMILLAAVWMGWRFNFISGAVDFIYNFLLDIIWI